MQLERAYLRFVKRASDTKPDHREEKWDRNKLSMTSTLSRPYWKGKAATNLAVAKWLVHATREDMQNNPDNPKACHRANFWWGLISAIHLWQEARNLYRKRMQYLCDCTVKLRCSPTVHSSISLAVIAWTLFIGSLFRSTIFWTMSSDKVQT